MAYFHTTVLDNQIKALDTIGNISGAICTFDTDRAERLVKCVCEVASGLDVVSVFVNSINIWNEQWEIGGIYYSTGQINNSVVDRIRTKYFILCSPSTTYYMKATNGYTLYCYDENHNFISRLLEPRSAPFSASFTTPANAKYLKIGFEVAYGTTYNNDFSINYPSTDTTYHAFSGVIVDLGETLSGDGTFDVLSGILTRSDDTTKHVGGNVITAQVGENTIYADTGDIIDLKFILTVGQVIS